MCLLLKSFWMLCSFLFIMNVIQLMAGEWVIVANAPSMTAKQIGAVISGLKIMALDGAANRLRDCNLLPDVILGDFDSIQDIDYWGIREIFGGIDSSSEPYLGRFGILIVPAKDQDFTDLEKGILFCDSNDADSICIINATGGRLDHTLGNIGMLRKYHRPDRSLVMLTETEQIEYVKDGTTTIEGPVGAQCAIMGYPEAVMTTTGLAYNGEGYPLRLGYQESTCNTLAMPSATIVIKGEALVIKPR